jgi:hypothetical protein
VATVNQVLKNGANFLIGLTGDVLTITSTGEVFYGLVFAIELSAPDSMPQGSINPLHIEKLGFMCATPPPSDNANCVMNGLRYRVVASHPKLAGGVICYNWELLEVHEHGLV